MLPILLPLDDPAATLELAGGKGANLSRLIRAGFPTPGGFIVTTAAYRTFIAAHHLAPIIADELPPAGADLAALEAASATLRSRLEACPIPDEIASALMAAYRALDPLDGAEPPVIAVRSSATAEDLPTASFAGQQDTLLNVQGEEALQEAVQRCWSSLWSARAIAYRARQGIPADAVSIAVVIQRMVPAEAAGVLFTLNPVTGNRDEFVIEAAKGLGEAVVAGQLTPDTMVVEKGTGQIRQTTVGGTQGSGASNKQAKVLDATQVAALAALGKEIERVFAGPQDIEWAIANGQPFILQTRPITAVGKLEGILPVPPGDDDWLPVIDQPPVRPFDLWTRANFGEVLPYPVSPFTLSGFQRWGASMGGGSEPDYAIARRLYGRIYANEGGLRHTIAEVYGMPTSLFDTTWGSRRPDLEPRGKFRPLRLARTVGTMLRGAKRPRATPATDLPQATDLLFTQIDKWVTDFADRDLSQINDQALWAESQNVWEARTQAMMTRHVGVSQRAAMSYGMLAKVVDWWSGIEGAAPRLVTSLSGVYSAEMGPMLHEMARSLQDAGLAPLVMEQSVAESLAQLRTHPDAGPFLTLLDHFLARHGYRCPGEPELHLPRWREQPEQVVGLVAGYLRAGEALDPTAQEARQRAEQEATVATILRRLDPIRARIFRTLLGNTQAGVRQRDNSRSYLAKLLYLRRACQVALGQRWAERGWLRESDDIFFLLHHELDAILAANDPAALGRDLQALVAGRRQAYEFWFTIEAPEVMGADGKTLPDPPGSDATRLRGIAASAGRITGTARLIDDPRQAARLQPGDILVTRATDPGWTPLFPLAGGLVLEIGGQLSHGAIVAREYGIPAVTNVYGAMTRLRDGQRITVDGTHGDVFLEPQP